MTKIVLFDADGVLTIPEEMFSVVYAHSHGLDPEPFEEFFRTQWTEIVTGKKDLKQAIDEDPDLWQWNGTTDELLEYWFKTEDIRNDEMLELVGRIREAGTPCYLATEQEQHRGNYMRDVMFKDVFDDYFITAEIGFKKSNPKFFEHILDHFKNKGLDIEPNEVLFFDDSQSKVDSALEAGLSAVLFEGVEQFKSELSKHSIAN